MTQQVANRPGSRICSSCVSTCTPWPCRGQRRLTPQPQLERKLQRALCQQCLRAKAAASGMPIGWCLPSLPRAESCRPCPQRPDELAARPCLMKTRKPMVPAFALPKQGTGSCNGQHRCSVTFCTGRVCGSRDHVPAFVQWQLRRCPKQGAGSCANGQTDVA